MKEEKFNGPLSAAVTTYRPPSTSHDTKSTDNNPPSTHFFQIYNFLPTPPLPSPVVLLLFLSASPLFVVARSVILFRSSYSGNCKSLSLPVWLEHARTIQDQKVVLGLRMWRETRNAAGSSSGDFFYRVKPECVEDVPKTSFKIKMGKTLSSRKWNSSFTSEGYLDIGKTLRRIQRAGIHPSIRGEVWEFLLSCYDPCSTFEERIQLRFRRRKEYDRLKDECRSIDSLVGSGRVITAPIINEDGKPIQDPLVLFEAGLNPLQSSQSNNDTQNLVPLDKKVIQWKLTLHQIGLDVVRTDRTLSFYEKKGNLAKLWDVLAVYAWLDKDIGYSQGMSDLCSPMIILIEEEADAFWCFERLMRRLRGNFRCIERSLGVENQLQSLAAVTQIIDPKLHEHLETLGGGDYLFAFRMLMVLFRREFSFGDSLYLWEMMWALEYDPDAFSVYEESASRGKSKSMRQFGKFERNKLKNKSKRNPQDPLPISIFLVASVLEEKSSKLLTEAKGLDDVIRILNDLNGNLDAKKACSNAMKLHKKYLKKAKNTAINRTS